MNTSFFQSVTHFALHESGAAPKAGTFAASVQYIGKIVRWLVLFLYLMLKND